MNLQKLLEESRRPTPACVASTQTNPSQEDLLRQQVKEQGDEIVRLKSLLTDAQNSVAELENQLEASKRRIQDLEEDAASSSGPTALPKNRGSVVHKGGGWNY